MRIVYLHQYFITPQMSGGSRSYEMAKRFVAAGHEVHIITSDRSGASRSGWVRTVESGINVHWTPVGYSNHMGFAQRVIAFFKFAFRSAFRAGALKADVVFATSTPLTIILPAVWAAFRSKAPLVFEVRDLWPEIPIALGVLKGRQAMLARSLERFAYRNAHQVVALSPGMKAGVARTGYPEAQIHVIPNSCDIDMFRIPPERGRAIRRKFDWMGDRPLVLYCGTLGRMNGVGYLVHVAEAMLRINPEVRFLVVGAGQEEESIKGLAASLGVLDQNFYMMGSVPKEQVPDLLSAATMSTSLFINLKEMQHNSANKFFDALAAARPIAINYGGWQAELLEKTGAGIVLPAVDYPKAAERLAGYLMNEKWQKAAAQAAGQLAEDAFARDDLAGQLLRVLEMAYRGVNGQSEERIS